jgi:hypothetical protein
MARGSADVTGSPSSRRPVVFDELAFSADVKRASASGANAARTGPIAHLLQVR